MPGFLSSNLIFAQIYVVDAERSKISWTGWKQLFGNTVSQKGNLKFRSGSFYKKDGRFVNAHLKMEMNSISHLNDGKAYTDNDVVTHLKSESCFFAEKYSEAVFQLQKVDPHTSERNGNSSSTITGTLTIKGITKPLSFPAQITQAEESLIVKAFFQISRKAFDLDLEPFLIRIGGDRVVRDSIDISVEIVAQPQS
jgi:polyisoprenoid-binding protein YceI